METQDGRRTDLFDNFFVVYLFDKIAKFISRLLHQMANLLFVIEHVSEYAEYKIHYITYTFDKRQIYHCITSFVKIQRAKHNSASFPLFSQCEATISLPSDRLQRNEKLNSKTVDFHNIYFNTDDGKCQEL